MFNEEDEIKRIFKAPITQPYPFEIMYKRSIIHAYQYNKNIRPAEIRRKLVAGLLSLLLIGSTIAIAVNFKSIKSFFRGLGAGVETAIENGYIETLDKEFINIDNTSTKVIIEDLLMDDMNLSASIIIKFDEAIANEINLEKVSNVELRDLIISDEENRILYSKFDKEAFEKYCRDNKLDYSFDDYNDKYMANGLNVFIESKGDNSIRLIYNMSSNNFPKSKKLYFSLGKIIIEQVNENIKQNYKIEGLWQVDIDVPEVMYNREKEYYKVTYCDNPNFEVYNASVSDTGFELGIIISNVEKPEFDEDKIKEFVKNREKINNDQLTESKFLDNIDWYYILRKTYDPVDNRIYDFSNNDISYLENESFNRFEIVQNATKNAKSIYLDNNKFDFYQTFAMTKYDATDNIKAVLYYKGKPVIIEFEKIK